MKKLHKREKSHQNLGNGESVNQGILSGLKELKNSGLYQDY
jgi:hypothetical protein